MDKKLKKPFVFLCTGMSLDGKLSNFKKEQIEIANNDDKEMLYSCRIKADAIMVGGNTLTQDDPKLTVKKRERKNKRISLSKSSEPIKIGIISNANKLKTSGYFFDVGQSEKIIFTTPRTSKKKIEEIKKKATVYVVGKDKVDLKKTMEIVYNYGVKKLMVEGGGELIFSLLREKLIDEINLKVGNLLIGGRSSITFVEGNGFDKISAVKTKIFNVIKKPNYLILKAKVIK